MAELGVGLPVLHHHRILHVPLRHGLEVMPENIDNTIYCTVFLRCFFFRNIPKDLDPSNKMDLDLWGCFGRAKTCMTAKFHRTGLVICSYAREEKTPSYS